MRTQTLVVALLMTATAMAAQTQSASPKKTAEVKPPTKESEDAKPRDPRAEILLERSYGVVQQLSDGDKSIVLPRIAQVASRRASRKFAKKIAEELYRSAEGLTGRQRDTQVMQAISAMSDLDTQRALTMLRDAPAWDDSRTSFANNRQDAAAQRVYTALWSQQELKAVPLLRETSLALAAKDHYPFMAMAPIVGNVGRKDPELAETIFREALDTYRNGARSLIADASFVYFVIGTARAVPTALAQQAIEAAVHNLLAYKPDPSMDFHGQLVNDTGAAIKLTDPSDFYLLQLLRTTGDLGGDLKAEAIRSRPELARAFDQGRSMGLINDVPSSRPTTPPRNTVPTKPATPPESIRLQNAERALAAAKTADDPAQQAEALSLVAQASSTIDRQRAAKLLDDALETAGSISDPAKRLRTMVGIAETAERIDNAAVVREASSHGFALADTVVRQDMDEHPEQRGNLESFSTLTRLARVSTKVALDATIGAIDGVSSPFVRAMLLVIAAENLEEQPAHVVPLVTGGVAR